MVGDIAKRDENYIPALQAISSIGNKALVDLWANALTHALLVETTPSSPTSSTTNTSYIISYNAAGDVIIVQKTNSFGTFTRTISNTDSVVASTKAVSTWV